MSQTPIKIVDYDPKWRDMYLKEERKINEAIGDRITAIEHIGSTSVPGLGAKPIIDIMVGVKTLDDAEECIGSLEQLGYDYVPELEEAMPERRYFRKTASGKHTHHIHMVETTSDFWERHLLFRDYLRDHPEAAERYEELKRELAKKYRHNMEAYEKGKTAFIREIERKAREHYNRQ